MSRPLSCARAKCPLMTLGAILVWLLIVPAVLAKDSGSLLWRSDSEGGLTGDLIQILPARRSVGQEGGPAQGSVLDECLAQYCRPGYDGCAAALCQPTTSGCAAPCISIYTADPSPCLGACRNLQSDPQCVQPYMGTFMECTAGCWNSSTFAECGYACLAALESSAATCQQGPPPTPTPQSFSTPVPVPSPSSSGGSVPLPPDFDGDGVFDDDDLCRFQRGTKELAGCPKDGIAAGDLIFRWGRPARGAFYTGHAQAEGRGYNFGHVGMYAGDWEADRRYQVRHPNGLIVRRWNSNTGVWDGFVLQQGDYVQPGDMVPEAVIEGDIGYGGVGISNLNNFIFDNGNTGGSYTNLYYGRPVGGLTPEQRRNVIRSMGDFAGDTEDGHHEFATFSTNCAYTTARAYTLWAGFPEWASHVQLSETWTPNYVASWMHLEPFWQAGGATDPGSQQPSQGPTIYYDSSSPRVSFALKSPADLHIYDASGRHTGPVPGGYEAQIPHSEYWEVENGHKVANILWGATESYRVEVESYAQGSFDLEIDGFNYWAQNQAHSVHYDRVVIDPQTRARVALVPGAPPDQGALALEVDANGDGHIDRRESATIQQSAQTPDTPFDSSAEAASAPLLGLACLGSCGGALALGALIAALVVGRGRRGLLVILIAAGALGLCLAASACLAVTLFSIAGSETSPGVSSTAVVTVVVERSTPSAATAVTATVAEVALSPEEIMSGATETMRGVTSARIVYSQESVGNYTASGEGVVVLPDRAHVYKVSSPDQAPVETIIIGTTGYWVDDSVSGGWNSGPFAPFASNPARWVELLQFQSSPSLLGQEMVNGEDCYHLQFVVTVEPGWLGLLSGGGHGEAWVSTQDYSLVQASYDLEYQGSRESGHLFLTIQLSDLNEPVSIEAPR